MTAVDEKIDRAADRLAAYAEKAAAEGGVKAKLAQPLADDAQFIRKLKPSLIRARAKGELPKNGRPASAPPVAPAGPQLGERKLPKRNGGPNPFLVVGVAFAVGIAAAKWLDWRGHAHPRR